jgi:hypothetical protein
MAHSDLAGQDTRGSRPSVSIPVGNGPAPVPPHQITRAIWHLPNSDDEIKRLRDYFKIENLRQPHPFDDEPPGR